MRTHSQRYQVTKLFCLLLLGFGLWGVVTAQSTVYLPVIAKSEAAAPPAQTESDKELAIAKVAAAPTIAPILANHPGWVAEAYADDESERIWHVDFYTKPDGDYLGYGHIKLKSDELFDIDMPPELTPAELKAGIAKIEAYLPYDAEVTARLGNPKLWYHDLSYDRWEKQWKVYYSRGLEELLIGLSIDENDNVSLENITDPALLTAEEAAEERRNRAINLAYGASGIDEALTGVDNWHTYVEDHSNDHYTVAFTANGATLYSVLVDLAQDAVVEAGK
jgi:hypothetical protein